VPRSPYRNEILAALPADDLNRLLPLLSREEWANGQPLQERHEPIEQMYFAERGFEYGRKPMAGSKLAWQVGKP
jgi:hypothetical protein